MSDEALNKHLDWLDRCAEEQANEPNIPNLTDYPKRLAQLNDLFATNEESWDAISREDLIRYLTTMLLWHELEHGVGESDHREADDKDVERLEGEVARWKRLAMYGLFIYQTVRQIYHDDAKNIMSRLRELDEEK